MAERKFTKSLGRPGMAAQLRETMSQVVRETTQQTKIPLTEPIDYEEFIDKQSDVILNDSLKDILIIASDDVSLKVNERPARTIIKEVGLEDIEKSSSLLTQECIISFISNWKTVEYKYGQYSGSYSTLPKLPRAEDLPNEVYEVDAVSEDTNYQNSPTTPEAIFKSGYLMKGPEGHVDKLFSNIASKSFKKRFIHLRQTVDGTYILDIHKDDRQRESKGAIILDMCDTVSRSQKKGRFCFEIRVCDSNKSYLFAAESESELIDWLDKINAAIIAGRQEEKKFSEKVIVGPVDLKEANTGTLRGLEHSLNPQLLRYARETDTSIAAVRRDRRQNIFGVFPDLPRPLNSGLSQPYQTFPWEDQRGISVTVTCQKLLFKVQSLLEGLPDDVQQIEPYVTSLALYDVKQKMKISENFYFNLDSASLNDWCSGELSDDLISHKCLDGLDKKQLKNIRKCYFKVLQPDTELYIVLRIEKVLQGSPNQIADQYCKLSDTKSALKMHKSAKAAWSRLGRYLMPFAWAARPLFNFNGVLDCQSEFSPIYRQDVGKLTDEDLLKTLQDFRRGEKMSRLTVIPGVFKAKVETSPSVIQNCFTPFFLPVHPFLIPNESTLGIEVATFPPSNPVLAHPFTCYSNFIYIYPKSLKFDSQKIFNRARNITCTVELRDCDSEEAAPLKNIYDSISDSPKCCATLPVLHHCTTPQFYSEIKVLLPIELHAKHHVLFTFHHVSCDPKRKDLTSPVSVIGYSWFPLLKKNRLSSDDQFLPVATYLPSGYLAVEPLGLGKGYAGPDLKWIDGQKPLFSVSIRVLSSIHTTDPYLHNFFVKAQKLKEIRLPNGMTFMSGDGDKESSLSSSVSQESAKEFSKYVKVLYELSKDLKALQNVEPTIIINFLDPLMTLLLRLIVWVPSEEVTSNVILILIHIFDILLQSSHVDLLEEYIQYIFDTNKIIDDKSSLKSTVHAEMLKALLLITKSDCFNQLRPRFLRQSEYFFGIISKSMSQYLLYTDRIKMKQKDRFPTDYLLKVQQWIETITPVLIYSVKDLYEEVKLANLSLAQFIKRCLSLMDRGFTFRMINQYLEQLAVPDSPLFRELKLEFIRLINQHEHFVTLNLPLFPNKDNFVLSDDFCKRHFLAGILLREIKAAMYDLPSIRRKAIQYFCDHLVKHAFNDRLQGTIKQSRVCCLYLPFISVVMDNINRLDVAANNVFSESPKLTVPNSSPQHRYTGSLDKSRPLSTIPGQPDLLSSVFRPKNSVSTLVNGYSCNSDIGSCRSSDSALDCREDSESVLRHRRNESMVQCQYRHDKLSSNEVRNLLVCFLYLVKHVQEELLICWWESCSGDVTRTFFDVLQLCLRQFRYFGKGKMTLTASRPGVPAKAMTLPARMQPPNFDSPDFQPSKESLNGMSENETHTVFHALLEANMATEVGLITLDALGLYCATFPDQLLHKKSENSLLDKIFDVYLYFLQVSQSETLLRHVFAGWRCFLNKFAVALFEGSSTMCGRLCFELLRCCNSKLSTTRHEACALLYLLMRTNFEYSKRSGIDRVHLQVIVSVSQLLGEMYPGINSILFQESLARINSYANSDKAMEGTGFQNEVKDLTRRIRTVLMATAQLHEFENDLEMLCDLQYSLANSYASTPELRRTWLDSLAKLHSKNGNYSETAMCQIHIAALMAEYLRHKNIFPLGCEAFYDISINISEDERNHRTDRGNKELLYSEECFLQQLHNCADALEKAERYELLVPVYNIAAPIYRSRGDYKSLADCFERLHRSCLQILGYSESGRRFLGTYYRVAFYNQAFFEEESGKQYIYKEPKVTSLGEISHRLQNQFGEKFGHESVKLLTDSDEVNMNNLDLRFAYIQITHVTPYFSNSCTEVMEEFERNNNPNKFSFATPFIKNDCRKQGEVHEQWKKLTILTVEKCFPYVKKRIPVVSQVSEELSPVEVAIQEMTVKVKELKTVLSQRKPDIKKLELRLQGAIQVQVNAGPIAYAEAFLAADVVPSLDEQHVKQLKLLFKELIVACNDALDLSEDSLVPHRQEYYQTLVGGYHDLLASLAPYICDLDNAAVNNNNNNNPPQLVVTKPSKRNSMQLFDMISASNV